MSDPIQTLAIVGAGMIGASWAALASAHGVAVSAYDPNPEAEPRFLSYVERARAQLTELGLTGTGSVSFSSSLAEALEGAGFVQENGPENEAVKRKLLAEIDALLPPEAIIASSTSALVRSAIVVDCARPERIIVAHPFNPPHLVPLIEIIGGEKTAPEVVDWALRFFAALGKKPIRVDKEVTGFLTNRLQFALLREAVHCVAEGIASPQAIEDAMRYGLGPRWAVMGALTTFTLAGGEGGMPHVLSIAPELQKWMDACGTPQLTDPDVQQKLIAAAEEITKGRPLPDIIAWRNERLVDLLRAVGPGTEKA